MSQARPMAERFWEKVPVRSPWPEDCWEWTAARDPKGYGRFGITSKDTKFAHNIAWILSGSEIQAGMELDHACHNPACVRPEHLSLVPAGYNRRQGQLATQARKRERTHCRRGHAFDEENTYWQKGGRNRLCRACRRMNVAAWNALNRRKS